MELIENINIAVRDRSLDVEDFNKALKTLESMIDMTPFKGEKFLLLQYYDMLEKYKEHLQKYIKETLSAFEFNN